MTPVGTPYLSRLVTLAALLVAAGLLAGRVELLAAGAPLLVLLTAGLLRRAPALTAGLGLAAERIEEGRTVQVTVTLDAGGAAVDQVEVEVLLSRGLTVVEGSSRFTVDVRAGVRREVTFTVRPRRWGVHRVGPLLGTAYARDRLAAWPVGCPELPLRVLPRPERFGAGDSHPFTRVLAGTHVARAAGSGVEFEGIRPFLPGDQLRRVNWRVSARTGELHVTEHRPERNAEVVLFLDAFVDRGPDGARTLDVAVRAALGIAGHYAGRMDRVGVVGFGGVLRWLPAGSGRAHLHRIAEHLLGTELVLSYAWKDVDVLPPRAIPPRALVLALSPLLDRRAVGALADLARRGHGVVVVDVSPPGLLPPPSRPEQGIAQRIWLMERATLVRRLGEIGVPVVPWRGPGSLDTVLVEVARLHARPRVARR